MVESHSQASRLRGDPGLTRRPAGGPLLALAVLLSLPAGAAAQNGEWPSLPDPPGSDDAGFRLAQPRVAPVPEAEWTAAQRVVAETYAAAGDASNALATMLHAPELAEVVHPFLDYAARESTLSDRHRKLLILRTAWVAQNAYLWADHASDATSTGMTAGDLRRIAVGPDADGWTPFEAALLGLVDQLYRNSSITDATWAALAGEYGMLNMVDAVTTVAEFTTFSMLYNTLGVQPDAASTERLPADVPYQLVTPDREPALTSPRIEPIDGDGPRARRTLAQHSRVAETWGGNTEYVNRRSPLTPGDRELLILRIGWNCQAEYEWARHVGEVGRARDHGLVPRWIAEGPESPRWEPYQVALLQAADELYRHAIVSDETWDTLAELYDTHRLISVVMTVSTYRFVSMMLNAFGVQLLPDDEGFPVL